MANGFFHCYSETGDPVINWLSFSNRIADALFFQVRFRPPLTSHGDFLPIDTTATEQQSASDHNDTEVSLTNVFYSGMTVFRPTLPRGDSVGERGSPVVRYRWDRCIEKNECNNNIRYEKIRNSFCPLSVSFSDLYKAII